MTATAAQQADDSIIIQPVETAADLDRFIRVPWLVYRNNPEWVPPLMLERREALSETKNPYFRHARARFWLALRNGEAVGRISAQIDDLAQGRQGEKVGHFGLIEAVDDAAVFQRLFAAAEEWLRSQGMKTVLGPFNLSINEECGLLVKGFERPPMLMMAHGQPYYQGHVEALGYAKKQDLFAYFLDIRPPMRKRMADIVSRAEGTGRIHLRPVSKKKLDAELETIRGIFNDAWSENWGFIPITRDEMQHMAEGMKLLINEDMCYLAEIDGKTSGFMIALPNLNDWIKDLDGSLLPFGWAKLLWRLKFGPPKNCRVPLMGIRKEYQNSTMGIAAALMMIESIRVNGVRRGAENAELSWILEDNKGMRSILGIVGSNPYKVYRIYGKELG